MTSKITKSVKFSAIVALLVLMAVGMDSVFADNQAQIDLYEFDKLLEGVQADILSTQDKIEPISDTTDTIPAEFIAAQISYLEAFDEVIQKQIL